MLFIPFGRLDAREESNMGSAWCKISLTLCALGSDAPVKEAHAFGLDQQQIEWQCSCLSLGEHTSGIHYFWWKGCHRKRYPRRDGTKTYRFCEAPKKNLVCTKSLGTGFRNSENAMHVIHSRPTKSAWLQVWFREGRSTMPPISSTR